MRRIDYLIPVKILLAYFCLTVSYASALDLDEKSTDKVLAPNFSLLDANGKSVALSDKLGEVVLVNFWASWCGPCRKEMPILNEIQKKFADKGVTVIGVNVDQRREKADKYLSEIHVEFPILFDTHGDVSELYSVMAMPSTAILDRQGNIRLIHAGYKSGDEKIYDKIIETLAQEMPVPKKLVPDAE